MGDDLSFRQVPEHEIHDIYKLESEGYPEDEAASIEILTYRRTNAPDLTVGCYRQDVLLGFVCATRYHGEVLTHESLRKHIPEGESVCIHSVVVGAEHRRQGVALRMLAEFVRRVWVEQKGVVRILLICKYHLIPLYTKAGFDLKGKSSIVHGKDPWYELQLCRS